MTFNQVGSATNYVPAMSYTPATRKVSASESQNQANDEPNELDELLDQLSDVITGSVNAKDSSKPQALLQLLGEGSGQLGALPEDLVDLINNVTGLADSVGKGDEFKALLREYVAVKWALAELDAAIAAQQAGGTDTGYHYEQLAAANAFMRQLSTTLSGQLDKLAAEYGYSDWLEAFREELEEREELRGDGTAAAAAPKDVSAANLVAYLLRNAPRPELEQINPEQQAPEAAVSAPTHDPYH